MKQDNNILALLGIPSEKIQSYMVESEGDMAIIYIDLKDIRNPCPKCNSTNNEVKGYYQVKINNSIIKHKDYRVILNVRRYKCKKCGCTYKQEYNLYQKNDSISMSVKDSIIQDLKEELTLTQIAKDHNLSINTVRNIFDKYVLPQMRLPLTEIICIDEFCYKHSKSKYDKYPAVITDPLSNKILDIVVSRWKDVLIEYFNKISPSEKRNVKYFVSDMNETYRTIKRIFFKTAIHIADRFHVVKCFNDAVTAIRTRIMKEQLYNGTKEYYFLKKNWKIFLMNRNKLKSIKKVNRYGIVTDQCLELDRCLERYPELFYAYWVKEEFRRDTAKLTYYYKALETINYYIHRLINSAIPEIAKVGKTLQNWKDEIVNGLTQNPYSLKISNAIAESTNNSIGRLIRISNGLSNFNRMRKRSLYINRNKND